MPIRARTLLMFQEAMLVMRRLYRGGVRFAMPARRCRDGKVPGPRKHKPPFQGRWNGGSRSAFVTLLKEGAWQSGRGNRGKPKSGGRVGAFECRNSGISLTSERRRVGKEGFRKGRSRWWPVH